MYTCVSLAMCTHVSICMFLCERVSQFVVACLYIHSCLCVSIFLCASVSMCLYLCTCVSGSVYSCLCMYLFLCVHLYMCACVYVCVHTYLYVYLYVCMLMSVYVFQICMGYFCFCVSVCLHIREQVHRTADLGKVNSEGPLTPSPMLSLQMRVASDSGCSPGHPALPGPKGSMCSEAALGGCPCLWKLKPWMLL